LIFSTSFPFTTNVFVSTSTIFANINIRTAVISNSFSSICFESTFSDSFGINYSTFPSTFFSSDYTFSFFCMMMYFAINYWFATLYLSLSFSFICPFTSFYNFFSINRSSKWTWSLFEFTYFSYTNVFVTATEFS